MKSSPLTSPIATDPTLVELWVVKDATAQKFRNATEYFAHLAIVVPAQKAKKNRPSSVKSSAPKVASRRSAQNAATA